MITFEETKAHEDRQYFAREKAINLIHAESTYMFRRLIEGGSVAIYMADGKGYVFYVSPTFVRMLGLENRDHIIDKNLADVLFTNPVARADFLGRLNQTGSVHGYELPVTRKDGMKRVLSVSAHFLEDDAGKVVGVGGAIDDLTEKSRLQRELLTEKEKLEQILTFGEGVGSITSFDELRERVVEWTSRILSVRKCSLMMLDGRTKTLSIASARGLSEDVIRQTKVSAGTTIAGKVIEEGKPLLVKNIEYDQRFQRANRPSYAGRSFMVTPVRLGDEPVGVICVSDKIAPEGIRQGQDTGLSREEPFTEMDLSILNAIARQVAVTFGNVQLYKELTSLAVTDPMTNIYNYRQFSLSLEHEMKRCRRSGAPLCVIMIDLDDFKSYNDTFGHIEGDRLLKDLARIFMTQLREVDIVCRYAGDEFAMILPETNLDGAELAARKIRDAVGAASFKRNVTLSIGIAAYAPGLTEHDLVTHADWAMYEAKREGKNRVSIFRE